MFDKTFTEIKTLCHKEITEIWEESFTIIMLETGSNIGKFECSDIILVFSPLGDLVLMTERLYRKNYNLFTWLKATSAMSKESNVYLHDSDIYTSITHGDNFRDFTLYKRWWHEWARGLV